MGSRKALINDLVEAGLITPEQAIALDCSGCCLQQLIGCIDPIDDTTLNLPELRDTVNALLAGL